MVRETVCHNALITICLLLVCTTLGCAQSGKRGQQDPQGVTNVPATPTASPAERRHALVIGNAAYEMGLLRNPVHDANDMATALRQLGFEVTLLRDAALRPMVEAIDLFNHQLRQGGVGVFYFAGHGVQVGGENYLIPLQTRIEHERDVRSEAVPLQRVLTAMADAGNEVNILILDACRDNPYAGQWGSSQRGLAVIQAGSGSGTRQRRTGQPGLIPPPPTALRGTLIAYATAPGSTAQDGAGENGVYTKHLLQAMTIPGLSIAQVFKQTRYGVVRETEGRQTPWESSSMQEDVVFMPADPKP
jgi:uncharacterized caspase-like protein